MKNGNWLRSSYSGGQNNNCVELSFGGDRVSVRDSKNPAGDVLTLGEPAWTSFLNDVKHTGRSGERRAR
jgi:Domain of unknown function (DUF397)